MSSGGYEALLIPTRRLRLALLAMSGGAVLAGVALILSLPVVPLLKGGFGLLWVLSGAAEVSSLRQGMARIDRIGMDGDGNVRGEGPGGTLHVMRLLPGSFVLDRIAWLRLGFEDGLAYGELLTGQASMSEEWRRLLVIWRHRTSFGRSVRS